MPRISNRSFNRAASPRFPTPSPTTIPSRSSPTSAKPSAQQSNVHPTQAIPRASHCWSSPGDGLTETSPTVSVLVLNLNGREYLDSCLASLEAQVYPRDRFEIVVVDNGSTDGSLEFVRAAYPRVEW